MPLDMPVDFTDILAWAVKEMTIVELEINADVKKLTEAVSLILGVYSQIISFNFTTRPSVNSNSSAKL